MTTDTRDAGRFGLIILGDEEARRLKATLIPFEDFLAHPAVAPIVQPAPASLNLAHSVKGPWGMMHNDQYGCCVRAMVSHHLMQVSAYSSQPVPDSAALEQATLQSYFDADNNGQPFPPGAPQDRGCDELNELIKLKTTGFMGHTTLGVITIDPHNHEHVCQALAYLGGVDLAFQVQQNAIQDFEAHRPWTPGPLLNEGHAVFMNGYSAKTSGGAIQVVTWGDLQQGTWGWFDEVMMGCYAIAPLVNPPWCSDANAWQALLRDFGIVS